MIILILFQLSDVLIASNVTNKDQMEAAKEGKELFLMNLNFDVKHCCFHLKY